MDAAQAMGAQGWPTVTPLQVFVGAACSTDTALAAVGLAIALCALIVVVYTLGEIKGRRDRNRELEAMERRR